MAGGVLGEAFGTALACLGLAIWALASLGESEAPLVLAAAALYLLGTIAVTIWRGRSRAPRRGCRCRA